MSGKGDRARPSQVSAEQYRENWERTFGKDKDEHAFVFSIYCEGCVCPKCRHPILDRGGPPGLQRGRLAE